MADINNINAQLPPVNQNAGKIGEEAVKLPTAPPNQNGETAVERDGVGQPIGLPTNEPTTQTTLMPGVVTGRDPSQLIAAEKMRSNAGHSATDVLLGLNRQPSVVGVLLAPPGNLEALRHLSPAVRRGRLRNLLSKQRDQMRQLAAVMRDDEQDRQQRQRDSDQDAENESNALQLLPANAAKKLSRGALQDLEATTKMLDLLDELMGMQDYTVSQIGTFAQG